MPDLTALLSAKEPIEFYFSADTQRLYSQKELASVLSANRQAWHLPTAVKLPTFLLFLKKHSRLQLCKLKAEAPYPRQITRYSWGPASTLELAHSLHRRGYFSHGTALALHKVGGAKPRTFYLNVEQSAKEPPSALLTQEALDRVFTGKQRLSKLVYKHGKNSVIKLAGKNTGRSNIIDAKAADGAIVPVTTLERTLIDIVVRPAYAGGPAAVLSAYRNSIGRVSATKILRILDAFDYVYPYHQSIGFLMEAAGYPPEAFELFYEDDLRFDFYLDYGMAQPRYSKKWRLHYPASLRLRA